ncbi:MAG: CDP-diacylglycerol--glycerol-3-phosphate 3-phosphatidyltransferase [Oscillospiraceae bacterium]|jgi:CDP-diacylglycerol--glycerol-3-phosphate 3-phosphatidyltransferase|nr:CDP-diacylglycerol--glycerol-3-phosphate 3-phosphatidyltransferase [Oscillospiraceae bacterium]
MNLPNKLTLLRVLMAPLFILAALWQGFEWSYLLAAVIFALAAATDAADGAIARKYGLITTFGKFLDPVADKLVTTAALLLFVHWGWCSYWVPVLILTREYCMVCLRLTAARAGTVLPASIWGKVKTVLQMVSVLVLLIVAQLRQSSAVAMNDQAFAILSGILLWGTAAAAALSGLTYFAALWRKGTPDTLRPDIHIDILSIPKPTPDMKLREWLPAAALALHIEEPKMLRHLRALALEEIACSAVTAMAVLFFLERGMLIPWPAFLLFGLEFSVASFRLLAAAQNKEPPARPWTIARVCALFVTIALYITAIFGVRVFDSWQLSILTNALFSALCVAYGLFGFLTVKLGRKFEISY